MEGNRVSGVYKGVEYFGTYFNLIVKDGRVIAVVELDNSHRTMHIPPELLGKKPKKNTS